ncbi:MAG: hypothetical protein ACLQVX_06270 [Limisphaerales bacterium]
MSLVTLLAAGKSVIGLRNGASPYRVTDQRLLPRFGFDKGRPCPSRTGSDKGLRRPAVKGARGPGAAGGPAKPVVAAVAAPASGESGMGRAGRWLMSRSNGLFRRPGTKRDRQPAARLDRSPIQVELCLERVRVVRNDLSDSGLELVQLRPKAPAAKPKEAGLARSAFCRLAAVRGLLGFFWAKRT